MRITSIIEALELWNNISITLGWNYLLYMYFCMHFTEGSLGGSCVTAAADSCSDPNAQCVNDVCECNEGYYDDDGVSDNNAGTCRLSK